jgi:hypothetical protein
MSRKHVEFYAASERGFGINLSGPEGDEKSTLHTGQAGQKFIHAIARKFVNKCHSAKDDDKLTPAGKQDAVSKMADECLRDLRAGIKKFVEPLVYNFTNFETTNLPALRKTVNVQESVDRMAVRQHVISLSAKERVQMLERALRQNDQEVLGAFFYKPELYRLLDPEFISKCKRQFISKNVPSVADAGKAVVTLRYNFQKTTEDLVAYASKGNEDGKAIFNGLPKEIDWQLEPNNDFIAIQNNQMHSDLPGVTAGIDNSPLSTRGVNMPR